MRWFSSRSRSRASSRLHGHGHPSRQVLRRTLGSYGLEKLQSRQTMTADPLPVLMVLADQQDFYYREYSDTRSSLESRGLSVVVAATTTNTTFAHTGTGQTDGIGAVDPDIALENVDAGDYSAIVFVGGWGASQYQYAFNDPNFDGTIDNYYSHGPYNGDDNLYDGQISTSKVVVNELIGQFLADDKQVAAICHGVTVLAWARVGGVSPLAGRTVAVPTTVSAPEQYYNGELQGNGYYSGQYDQVIDNGALASPVSGSIGNPHTVADDVWVDGNFITAENYDSASYFGLVIAQEVLADFAASSGPAVMVGNDLHISGTDLGDTIYIWSGPGNIVRGWINGAPTGQFNIGPGGRVIVYSGSGNDHVFATDLAVPATIYGGEGHDLITGGSADDVLEGGEGVDRLSGGAGNDLIRGGAGNDHLYGEGGANVLVGGGGDDYLEGGAARDLLIGGLGTDRMRGVGGQDVLIAGLTTYDHNDAALLSLLAAWNGPARFAPRVSTLSDPTALIRLESGITVHDDLASDVVAGGSDEDWYFSGWNDRLYPEAGDQVT